MVLCGLTALLAGLVEVLLTPLYVGRWLFPITLLLAVVTNVALPLTRATIHRRDSRGHHPGGSVVAHRAAAELAPPRG